jgi:hypothetical protein
MKKYSWIVALVLALSLGLIACDDKEKEPVKEDPWVNNLAGQTLDLVDNFQYGKGYQGVGTWPGLFNGKKVNKGNEYYIRITFTASRDLKDVLYVGLVDPSPAANYWQPLTWPGDPSKPALIESAAEDNIILAGEEVTFEYKFTATVSSTSATAAANAMVFMTDSPDGTEGTAGSGTLGTIKLTFTEFLFGNVEVDSLDPPEPPPPPPPVEEPEFTIDATAGTATHDNFKIETSTASAHGGWDGTDNEDGTFSYKGGAIRYQYPVVTGGFNFADYDFVEVEYNASDVSNSVLKQYATGLDYVPLSGSFANNEEGSFKFDLRYGGGGFAIQRYGTNATDMTVEITKITFIKGTRYAITFDPDAEGITAPTSPAYVVGETKVGPLPTLTRDGYILLGWVIGTTTVTANTDVTNIFDNATLKAQWKQAVVRASQTVTFSDNIVARGAGQALAAIDIVDSGAGYIIDSKNNSYGNSWAYFTYTFTNNAQLSDFNKITFKYTGLTGDINSKQIKVFAMTVTDLNNKGNYFGFGDPNAIISTQNVTGTEEISVVLEISQGAAAALDGATIGFAVGIHAGDYKIQITDFTFSQNE